jgi:1-phosphatidylinositol-3-phosphate 5-kinase
MPLYVREHAKRILRGSLYNDTKFLSDINVMDYSLVVGVESVSNELVVGIVGTQYIDGHSHFSLLTLV